MESTSLSRTVIPTSGRAEIGELSRDLFKRAFDVVVAMTALVAAAPLLMILAALVRLDSPGPVLFFQVRVGRGGRTFRIVKFRTMVVDAEQRLDALESSNEAVGGVLFRMTRDPRVTRIGSWLRRTSLDELPQLINVIQGNMSLVGPRPWTIRDSDRISGLDPEGARRRLDVRPGLTGLAQVRGRRELDPVRTLELDGRYVARRGPLTDLAILAETIPVVILGRGIV
jgi:lipopolysaccharide/colanic/teichoic acid biosynthesis glycosyltransferase